MENNKLDEMDLDDLLKLLDETGDSIESLVDSTERTIKRFIREYGIVPGQTRVPNYVIYQHYTRKWKMQGNKVSKIGFFRDFNKLFDQHRTTKVRYYLLNEGVFSLTDKDLKDAKHSDKIYENKRKKKNKKKSNKIPKSEKGADS